ncbi:hypothetical protein ACJ73_00974 [Blastomyces percursus]|uniref:ABC transporter domain-containing protein n=1 Tax=Blastomyces percursus TaxID=1658174 RepID=A0A1J9QGN7_9EURO|nr:hypothetical protein ACJ73_00974 [Blastomyces percursus]
MLSGLSLTSFAVFTGVFFQKSVAEWHSGCNCQLVLAIVAQVSGKVTTWVMAVFSFLFPPMNYVYFIITVPRWESQIKTAKLLRPAPNSPSTLTAIARDHRVLPAKNVLWDDLTVAEHIQIFDSIKSAGPRSSVADLRVLIEDCDLAKKVSTYSKHLSGGQKRKLQMVVMFAGRSTICCVDEVSSGVDPLSRRKLRNILLAERGTLNNFDNPFPR